MNISKLTPIELDDMLKSEEDTPNYSISDILNHLKNCLQLEFEEEYTQTKYRVGYMAGLAVAMDYIDLFIDEDE